MAVLIISVLDPMVYTNTRWRFVPLKCLHVFLHISKWANWHRKTKHQCQLQVMTTMSASEVLVKRALLSWLLHEHFILYQLETG